MSKFYDTPCRLAWLAVFAATLALGALGLAGALILRGHHLGAPIWALALLALLALAAEKQPVRVNRNTELVISTLPTLFAALVFGPLSAMAVAALGLLVYLKRPYLRWLVWSGSRSLAAGLAGVAATPLLAADRSLSALLVAATVAVVVEAFLEVLFSTVTAALRNNLRPLLPSILPILPLSVPLNAPALALLAYAYEKVSPWSALLFFAPAFAAQSLYRLYSEEREATARLVAANAQLERASLSFAAALVAALDARDNYTAGHSAAVAIYARDIAARLGLSEELQKLSHLSGLLHDIGKVGLPPGILEKPGPLTLKERRQMEEHPVVGERILANVEGYGEIARIVRHHHERIDGQGYPDRIVDQEIPLISRIICVADAYNAMTSGRPYRDAMSSKTARLRIAQAAGTQFDLQVVAAFDAILSTAAEQYLSGARADFALEVQQHPVLGSEVAA